MEDLITRTGGERETQAGKLIPSFVIDTAGAPASAELEQPATTDASAPEWIELLPAGVFYGRDGRGPFRLDDPDAVIESTHALQMNAGLPIDYDHATDFGAPEGRPAPAAGWIRELAIRTGALWGRVEWTAMAKVGKEDTMEFPVQELCELLGLDREASGAEVLAKVRERRTASEASAV